jgi:hypothetical protein
MENNIPTAEELFKEVFNTNHCHIDYDKAGLETIKQAMIEFAKLHVQAALKEALDSIPCLGSSSDIPTYKEVENAVLNAYPLDKIK